MTDVSASIVNNEIDRYGTSVTLSSNTNTYSDWGDKTVSTSVTTITVVHNDITGAEEFNREGIYRPGDKVFFCKSTDTVNEGDYIIFRSNTYEIKQVITHYIQATQQVQEARCNKVG